MFQVFHEVVVHQGPLDQLAGPTNTEDGQQGTSMCFVCVCVGGILCSLFALEIAGKRDISELGRVQSSGLGRDGLSLGALRLIGHRWTLSRRPLKTESTSEMAATPLPLKLILGTATCFSRVSAKTL